MCNLPPFTVCVLIYNGYPELAERVLQSLAVPAWRNAMRIRLGVNNPSSEVLQIVRRFTKLLPIEQSLVGVPPYAKYPLMRRLFHDRPITTPFCMWFDDDSWVTTAASDWPKYVEKALATFDQVGSIWYIRLRGNQHLYIEDAPWYTGRSVVHGMSVPFITGGWWAIRSQILMKHDWPPQELLHNGGDVMLGALFHQQDYRLGKFTTSLAINADSSGKCSTARRRGLHTIPLGVNYTR